jgi:DNA-binding MarR family transcriptional regulator
MATRARPGRSSAAVVGDPPEGVDLVELLWLAGRRVTERLAAALAEEGASLEDWRVLALLSGGGRSMSDLAEGTAVPPPTLTKRVDRLVAANLVHRRADDNDRRRVLVLLTPRGGALHDRLSPLVERERAQVRQLVEQYGDAAGFAMALLSLSAAERASPHG